MFNLYAVQEAGKQFAHLIGIKRQVYGRDGYTSFVPHDGQYDRARVAADLRQEEPGIGKRANPALPRPGASEARPPRSAGRSPN